VFYFPSISIFKVTLPFKLCGFLLKLFTSKVAQSLFREIYFSSYLKLSILFVNISCINVSLLIGFKYSLFFGYSCVIV
jgi:hypothetical protein